MAVVEEDGWLRRRSSTELWRGARISISTSASRSNEEAIAKHKEIAINFWKDDDFDNLGFKLKLAVC